jgi:putative intracellular protease/amidase
MAGIVSKLSLPPMRGGRTIVEVRSSTSAMGGVVSHKNLNRTDPGRPKRVAIVISNAAVSTTTGWPVGFWWSELTHPFFHFTEAGYEVEVVSPNGGACQADAMSDPEDASQWQAEDVISRGYKHDPEFMKLVENTKSVADLDTDGLDALVVTGGQGPMFTFQTATALHDAFVQMYEAGTVVAALCHGVAILRFARLSNGEPLVRGKTVTGFANVEEDFSDQGVWDAGVLDRNKHVMPWRIEDELRALGANFIQAGLWKGFAIRDGNLVTGQQNFSGTETAQLIIDTLGR